MILKAARRYAAALLQVAIETDRLEKILDDVRTIHETIEASRELKLFLRSPIIKPEEKRAALETIFGEQVDSLTGNFIDLVIRKGRERQLDQIMTSFIDSYKKYSGIVDVKVFSAMDLDGDVVSELEQALEKRSGKKVELQFSVKPELIGGIAVQIDDTVIDGSVRHKLERLRAQFREAAI